LRQQDDGIIYASGLNIYGNTTDGGQTTTLFTTFTLTESKAFGFHTFTADAYASQGLGLSLNISGYTEQYLNGFIKKLK
jgi:hypothetical protein